MAQKFALDLTPGDTFSVTRWGKTKTFTVVERATYDPHSASGQVAKVLVAGDEVVDGSNEVYFFPGVAERFEILAS